MQGYVLFGSDKVLCGYREHHAAMSSSDKLCTSAVVEVLRDLKQKFPGYHGILNTAMKTWFARYQHIAYNQDYAKVIKKNCEYVEKKQFNFLFQSVYFFCGFNITMRLMNKFVNG
jgi:hypothetical protein